MSFREFVYRACELDDASTDRHLCSQFGLLSDSRGKLLVDMVYFFERLDEDLASLLAERVPDARVELPKRNSSKRARDWSGYYDDELRSQVYRRYSKDFEAFGYHP